MSAAKKEAKKTVKTRRLSPYRVLFALTLIVLVGTTGVSASRKWQSSQEAGSIEPWFAGYVDVTATPTFAFEDLGSTDASKNMMLSFIVASKNDPCTPSWGTAYTLDQAAASLDLDRRIARVQQQDGSIAVSFGGLLNDELAVVCEDADKLYEAYEAVVNRYSVDTIDLDLEGTGLTDTAAGVRRTKALAKLQLKQRAEGRSLAIWVTLPVTTQGMTEDGTNAVSILIENGVDLAGVNAMTMNFGDTRDAQQSMASASINALSEVKRQLGILYERAGLRLSDDTLWKKIGATPMLGQNDIATEIFSLEDAEKVNDFASSKSMGRMSMWSMNRDRSCGGNYTTTGIVSDSCSGIDQDKGQFAQILGKNFKATLASSARVQTVNESAQKEEVADDPKTSPYQIWTEDGRYLQGTKVVWRKNVYEAKWWTQGSRPDNPVLQTWETPWKLIGPVLPGEEPVKQATLPTGTFPTWKGKDVYEAGQRVLFEGVPYQSKWWTQGDSPAAASSNADGSPWVPLTQSQIEDILNS